MSKKIFMTLMLLMTAASGAWATSDISRALLSVPNSWEKDQAVFLTAEELPGFKAVTEEEAANWVPTDEDIENGAFLIYGFDAEGNMLSYATLMGAPAIKVDPGKMPHNNMYGLTHGSMLQVRFYYTSDVTLVGDKTEATFTMPAADATVEYELVRDMSVSMTTQVGDGTDGYGIRLKKSEQQPGKYEPADMTVQQMMALVKVHDAIENYDLTFGVLGANCIVSIYAVDDQGEPTGSPIAFQDLVPGRYVAKAVGETTSTYEGETPYSNIFKLFEGYEVTIAAGEYATYFKDEALKVEDEDVELYTITAVEDGKAVLSDALAASKANMPIIVKNTTNEEKTFLLIPCNEPDLAVTVADEFIGTLTAKEFTENDMAAANYYVCNGIEFIQVRGAGTLAPNKAYLKVSSVNSPASIPFRRSIDGNNGDTTGIDRLNAGDDNDANAAWYDLNGRRLQGKPSQKGIYIKNGKKVVVK